ncbi:MAG TPA: TolC family protein [bacterium]
MMIFLLSFLAIDSLSLAQVVDIALSQSPIYYESKIALDKSRIQFYQAFSNLLPTLSATADYTSSKSDGSETNLYSGKLTLTQPVFDLDIISSILVSHHQLKSTNIQHAADISGLVLDVEKAYYNLIYTNGLLKSSETAIKRVDENKQLIETKYRIGAASKFDALQAEVSYLSALQDQAKAKTLQITAQEELKTLLATDNYIYPIDTLSPPLTFELPSIDSLAAVLVEVNNSIHIAQELEHVAQLDLISSYLAFVPKVSLFYGYTYTSDELVFDFQQWRGDAIKNYGISVSFPILEIKSLIFNNLNARKELQLQKFSKKRIILESEKSLHTAYYGLLEAHDRLQYASKGLDAATEAATIARQQYALGLVSFLELLTTEDNLNATAVALASAISDFHVQRATLSYLLGEKVLNKD